MTTPTPELRAASSRICDQAVKRMKSLDVLNHVGDHGDTTTNYLRTVMIGELHGLRVALCCLFGWNPAEEADKEERADDYIKTWHNDQYPDEPLW